MMKKKGLRVFLLICLLLNAFPAEASANPGLILRGLGRTLFSVVEIPRAMIEHSCKVIFPVGIVTGTCAGTYRMLVGTVTGAIEMAQGAAPYAKYMVFFI